MDRARELLEAERQQAIRRLSGLTGDFDQVVAASRDANADDEPDPEGAKTGFERPRSRRLSCRSRFTWPRSTQHSSGWQPAPTESVSSAATRSRKPASRQD